MIKRAMALVMVALMIVLAGCALSACSMTDAQQAAEWLWYEDFAYLVLEDETAMITAYRGKETSLKIPEDVDGVTVSCIGEKAFKGCDKLVSVEIPFGIQQIGYGAFADCSKLEIAIFDSGVTELMASEKVPLFNPKAAVRMYGLPASTAQAYAYEFGAEFEGFLDGTTWKSASSADKFLFYSDGRVTMTASANSYVEGTYGALRNGVKMALYVNGRYYGDEGAISGHQMKMSSNGMIFQCVESNGPRLNIDEVLQEKNATPAPTASPTPEPTSEPETVSMTYEALVGTWVKKGTDDVILVLNEDKTATYKQNSRSVLPAHYRWYVTSDGEDAIWVDYPDYDSVDEGAQASDLFIWTKYGNLTNWSGNMVLVKQPE